MIGNLRGLLDWGTVVLRPTAALTSEKRWTSVGITGRDLRLISTTTGGYYQFSADPAQDDGVHAGY